MQGTTRAEGRGRLAQEDASAQAERPAEGQADAASEMRTEGGKAGTRSAAGLKAQWGPGGPQDGAAPAPKGQGGARAGGGGGGAGKSLDAASRVSGRQTSATSATSATSEASKSRLEGKGRGRGSKGPGELGGTRASEQGRSVRRSVSGARDSGADRERKAVGVNGARVAGAVKGAGGTSRGGGARAVGALPESSTVVQVTGGQASGAVGVRVGGGEGEGEGDMGIMEDNGGRGAAREEEVGEEVRKRVEKCEVMVVANFEALLSKVSLLGLRVSGAEVRG